MEARTTQQFRIRRRAALLSEADHRAHFCAYLDSYFGAYFDAYFETLLDSHFGICQDDKA